eukprot:3009652-Amphidinium_carterae.1
MASAAHTHTHTHAWQAENYCSIKPIDMAAFHGYEAIKSAKPPDAEDLGEGRSLSLLNTVQDKHGSVTWKQCAHDSLCCSTLTFLNGLV